MMDNTKQAFFNAAMGSVIRLDHYLNLAVKAFHNGDYNYWHTCLQTIVTECWPKWDDKVRNEVIKKMNDPIPELTIYARINQNGGMTNPKTVQTLFQKLIDAERYIREHADKVGLLNPNKKGVMEGLGDVD